MSYSRLSFTNADEINLIKLVEKFPVLWDINCDEHRNHKVRTLCWRKIASRMKKTDTDCRRKWRFVRDYYLHKRKDSLEYTVRNDSKYQHLQFLNKIRTNSKVQVEDIGDDELDQLIMEEDHLVDVGDEPPDPSLPTVENGDVEDGNCNGDATLDYSDDIYASQVSNEDCARPTDLASEAPEPSNEHKAIDFFFQSMAATMKTFPPQLVAQAKMRLFSVMNELELEFLQA